MIRSYLPQTRRYQHKETSPPTKVLLLFLSLPSPRCSVPLPIVSLYHGDPSIFTRLCHPRAETHPFIPLPSEYPNRYSWLTSTADYAASLDFFHDLLMWHIAHAPTTNYPKYTASHELRSARRYGSASDEYSNVCRQTGDNVSWIMYWYTKC